MTNSDGIRPNIKKHPHIVGVVAFDGMVIGDFSTPCGVFSHVYLKDGSCPYKIKLCGVTRKVKTEHCSIHVPHTLAGLSDADTIIIPGISRISGSNVGMPKVLVRAIRREVQRGARVASICSGAFILAETGLLDGLKATTHWLAADELARRYPKVQVDANVLYVDNGNLLTSAGAAAGRDLCLHIIRTDYGVEVAANTARIEVMPLERAGGQAQFIQRPAQKKVKSEPLESLLVWVESNLDSDLSSIKLAEKVSISVRTLHRRFTEQIGLTPANWVLGLRIRQAQILLETTSISIKEVCYASGFKSTATFRERFRTSVGVSPIAYRHNFRK